MSTGKSAQEPRRKTNPLFNARKLKLGTFSSNLSGGCAITTIDGVLKADWQSTLTLARLADEMEFEALVPVGRWKGFGGVTNFNGAGFEPYTWAAAIGAATKYSAVFRSGDGVRSPGAGRPLEGIRGRYEFQRRRFRAIHLGCGNRRRDEILGRLRDVARTDSASDHGRQTGHDH